jgi:hypothetical protein
MPAKRDILALLSRDELLAVVDGSEARRLSRTTGDEERRDGVTLVPKRTDAASCDGKA